MTYQTLRLSCVVEVHVCLSPVVLPITTLRKPLLTRVKAKEAAGGRGCRRGEDDVVGGCCWQHKL